MMTPKSYKNSIFNLNDIYDEEVLDNELKNRKDPKIKEKKGINIIFILLFFICLGLLLWSIYYAFGTTKNLDTTVTKKAGEIAVVHSKVDFGLTIDSFLKYTSEKNASVYTFYIENDNDNEINYKIKLKELTQIGKAKIEVSYLKFSLIKNNKIVATGNLAKVKNNILVTETIAKRDKDMYTLKIWSTTPSTGYYKYEIEVMS